MLKTNAFPKAERLVATILTGMVDISKPVYKFLSTLFPLWWSMSGRYNFTNLSRYCGYAEQSIRNGFERGFDFFGFNVLLVQKNCNTEKILVFDPSFISKSGKHTPGLGWFWSGCAQRTLKGLEIGCLACVDVQAGTALHLAAIQTPDTTAREGKSLIAHYLENLLSRISILLSLSNYLVVDGYFMKKEFILPLTASGMQVITKMRSDANLYYPVREQDQPQGRGRKRIKGKKINLRKIDKRRWKHIGTQQGIQLFTALVYCAVLKRLVRVVYLLDTKTQKYEMLLCTDKELSGEKIVAYYRLRFQIEFLLRDAKQHGGLQDCQARSRNKLNFHFNMALTSVSVAKAAHYLSVPENDRGAFSLQSIKRYYHNKLLTEIIFDNLALDLNCKKIIRLFNQCLEIGAMAP
jgi:hypothetical protein